jgi:hypothetical protein
VSPRSIVLRRLGRVALTAAAVAVVEASSAGAAPTVRTLVLSEDEDRASQPLPLTATSFVIPLVGFDNDLNAVSGRWLLVEHLDGDPVVTPLPMPEGFTPAPANTSGNGTETMIRLSATRILVVHNGADNLILSEDEGLFLVDDVGGANTVVPIPIGPMGDPQLVRLDERSALVMNEEVGTLLLSDLGGANVVTPLGVWWFGAVLSPTRFLARDFSDQPVLVRLEPGGPEFDALPDSAWGGTPLDAHRLAFIDSGGVRVIADIVDPEESFLVSLPGVVQIVKATPDCVFVRQVGPDEKRATADDSVARIADIAAGGVVTTFPVPGASEAPVPMGCDSAVVPVVTPDIDDGGFAIVRRGAPSLFFPLFWHASPIALSTTRVLAASEGPSPFESPEDEVMNVLRLDGRPRKGKAFAVPHATNFFRPRLLGNGRAIQYETYHQIGSTRVVRILDGLPGGARLERVALTTAGPEVSLRARFALPDPSVFGSAELTARIGNVLQRIPAESIVATRRGFRYEDPSGEHGFFRLVEYDVKRGVLRLSGRSVLPVAPLGTNRVISLESSEFYVAVAPPEAAD